MLKAMFDCKFLLNALLLEFNLFDKSAFFAKMRV